MLGQASINAEQRDIASTVWSYQQECGAFKVKDPYKLRTKTNLLREGWGGVWNQCSEGGWGYNTSQTYATAQIRSFGGRPCAAGRYRARGLIGLQHLGDWKSDTVDSPPHQW